MYPDTSTMLKRRKEKKITIFSSHFSSPSVTKILEAKSSSKLVEQNLVRSNPLLKLAQTLIMINDKYIGFVPSIERANNYEQIFR